MALTHPPKFAWTSFATTHIGKVRKINQDAYVNLPDNRLWAVADGMGGHEAGEFASAAIVNALSQLQPGKTLGGTVNAIYAQLNSVNRELVDMASAMGNHAVIGSTVAILLAQRQHFICLWSGDSRIYLLRKGQLKQLSRDHNYASKLLNDGYDLEQANNQLFSQSLIHATGVELELYLEAQMQELQSGDKFLLCSDGLTKEVSDADIESVLNTQALEQAVAQLLLQTLTAGARDNVTIVAVETSLIA
ncbi:PP2C family protein-serine/threonine phosphatase [Crenothrix polyspora]|uniref:Protein phosphatase PrpC n=1 Tax=Crenothrix polyspora TaxID=360316 RepID=A0A1R4HAB2_9GAMM|nr:PP2C family serine/threonine-protein phosphatase [Crenothrix polyspora]SJM93149.1 Protein phosphatase PrpC [Crenothrix polyspora]